MKPSKLFSVPKYLHFFISPLQLPRRLCVSGVDENLSDFNLDDEPVENTTGTPDGSPRSHDRNSEENACENTSSSDPVRIDAARIFNILRQDGPGFDATKAMTEAKIRVSTLLVRQVLLLVLRRINSDNKERLARLGFKFFLWSGQQENFRPKVDSYHLVMRIFSECEEIKAMVRLVDDMIEKGVAITAQTLNILICSCKEVGLAKDVIESFIKSKKFNYRPFKHSYNAILYLLLVIRQYKLIEWVYKKMLDDGLKPDALTYNILMRAKYSLGKLDQLHSLLDEMGTNGFSPDLYTYNLLLHILGKGDKPMAALSLLNHMKAVGVEPSVLHYTTLMDGLGRAGNLEACKFFFKEITRNGYVPDVVCHTVMITGLVMAGELENAQQLFDEMPTKGQVPNAFTYNSMIRGFCMDGDFCKACSLLREMESKGCDPNFVVYNTLIRNLRSAGRTSDAHKLINEMITKGKFGNVMVRLKQNKRF